MDVHPIKNGIYRYWPIPISTSYPKASADPASSSTSCWTSDGNCVFFLILEPGEENSPQLPKVKDWENQQMSIPKKENIGVYVTCIHVYVYLYIYIEPLEFALIGDTRSPKKTTNDAQFGVFHFAAHHGADDRRVNPMIFIPSIPIFSQWITMIHPGFPW